MNSEGDDPVATAELPRPGRSYLSIGEVLDALREQFPDVTISKIRFFESQGLLVPERTPSGYRKFYAADLDRLRVILIEQQERYVPLSAARSTLAAGSTSEPITHSQSGTSSPSGPPDEFFAPDHVDDEHGGSGERHDSDGESVLDDTDLGADRHPSQRISGARPATGDGSGRDRGVLQTPRRATVAPLRRVPSQHVVERREVQRVDAGHVRTVGAPEVTRQDPADRDLEFDRDFDLERDPDLVYSIDELIAATGATSSLVADAMRQDFLVGRSVFGETEFDEGDRRVLTSLVTFAAHGIDPRHVRVFLHAAQREADLYVQATLPLLRRRPRAGVNAEDPFRRFSDLEHAGATLRTVVVRRALQQATEGTPGPVGR